MNEDNKEIKDELQELVHQIEELKKSISTKTSLPVAIVIAGIFIAGSVMYATTNYRNNFAASVKSPIIEASGNKAQNENFAASAEDHILGNKNALIKIVEYSDLECPFCKMFHQTMNKIMDTYGQSGKVAWIYRHFPLDQLHSKARNEARATECAAEQGGNDAFWKFTNKIFEITPSNNELDPSELQNIAVAIGIDKTSFVNCLSSNKYNDRIEKNIQDGIDAGAQGTPYSIIFTQKGRRIIVNGAQPYEEVKKMIDQALAEQ